MPVSEERFALAQVTRTSRDGWRRFARKHGTNPTALAEVVGRYLATVVDDPPEWLQPLIEDAEALQHQRSRRSD